MKKIILIALVCTMGLTILGCQAKTESGNESSATQIQSTASTEGTIKEKIVCTIKPDGGKKTVISDERAETVYDLLKNQPTTDPSAYPESDSTGNGRIEVILTTDSKQEYYIVFESDMVSMLDTPTASDMKSVGYVKGIYKTINEMIN